MASTPEHNRRSIRLQGYDYFSPGAYFITICTFQRSPLLGEIVGREMHLNTLRQAAHDCWNALPNHFPQVKPDSFVVMPNHVHGVLWLTPVGAQHAAPLHPVMLGAAKHLVCLQTPLPFSNHPPSAFPTLSC
jgi:hypothetical protein